GLQVEQHFEIGRALSCFRTSGPAKKQFRRKRVEQNRGRRPSGENPLHFFRYGNRTAGGIGHYCGLHHARYKDARRESTKESATIYNHDVPLALTPARTSAALRSTSFRSH